MTYLFANNARSTLAAGINDSVTALSVQTGDGLLFPNPTGVEEFRCVLYNDAGAYEIIKVTTRATDAFSVIVRGQEGTSPAAWSADDYVSSRTTKESLEYLLQHSDVDDTPVDSATDVPVSSNWAFDHAADTDAHGGPYNNYVHPSHDGDDIDADTTLLSGATVISDLDFNITTDTLGHVTDATLTTLDTRELAPSDIGASADTHNHDSDYISVVTTPTTGNFPQLTAGGELVNSTYDETSFATAGHIHDAYDRASSVLADDDVFSNIVVTDGIVTDTATRALTPSDIGAAGLTANTYTGVQTISTATTDSTLDIKANATAQNAYIDFLKSDGNRAAYLGIIGDAGPIVIGGSPVLTQGDVDDTPVDSATSVPVSSNWAFDMDAKARTSGKQVHIVYPSMMVARDTAGAQAETLVAGSDDTYDVWAFDPSVTQYVYFPFLIPPSWDNTTAFSVKVFWTHPTTTTNFDVVWNANGGAANNGETLAVANGTGGSTTDTGGTADYLYISSEVEITAIGGTATAGNHIQFRIQRAATSGSDTLAVDARVVAVALFYSVTEGNEA